MLPHYKYHDENSNLWSELHDILPKMGFTIKTPIDSVIYYQKNIDNISINVSEKNECEVIIFDYGEDTELEYTFITYKETINFVKSVIRKTKIKRLIE